MLKPVGGTFLWEQNVCKEHSEKLQKTRGTAAEFLLNFHWVAAFKCVLGADFGESEPKVYEHLFGGNQYSRDGAASALFGGSQLESWQ